MAHDPISDMVGRYAREVFLDADRGVWVDREELEAAMRCWAESKWLLIIDDFFGDRTTYFRMFLNLMAPEKWTEVFKEASKFHDLMKLNIGCNTRKMLGSIGQNPTNANENRTYLFPKFLNVMAEIMLIERRGASRAFKSESVQIPVEISQLEGRRGIYHRRTIRTPTVPDDGHSWKRYDQKEIPNATYLRNCFRCFHKYTQGCQASRWVQRIESDPVLYKVTYIGRHTCKPLPHREGTEWLILSMTFIFECLSLIFENLYYPLLGMVMGNVGFIICVVEFYYRARTEQVALWWRGKLPLLYSRYPIYKPFGSMLQWFGLVATCRVAMPQLLHYAHKHEGNIIKILIIMVVLCICLAFNKIVKLRTLHT